MTDLQIVAYTAMGVALIGSFFTGIVSVIVAFRTSKKAEVIHDLVNGNATVLLREISELKARIAATSGRDADIVSANSAKTNLDEKVAATVMVAK